MNNYSKRITALILLISHALMSCWNPPSAKKEIPPQQEKISQEPLQLNNTNVIVSKNTFVDTPTIEHGQSLINTQVLQPAKTILKAAEHSPLLKAIISTESKEQTKNHTSSYLKYKFAYNPFSESSITKISSNQSKNKPKNSDTTSIATFSKSRMFHFKPGANQAQHRVRTRKSDNNEQAHTSQIFIAKGGHQVIFMDANCNEAIVDLNIPKPLSRRLHLKVKKQNSNLTLEDLVAHTSAWQQHHIHIYLPENDPNGKGCVYIGHNNWGLDGGGKDRKDGKDEKGCKYSHDKYKRIDGRLVCPSGLHFLEDRSPSSFKDQGRESPLDLDSLELNLSSIRDFCTAFGEDVQKFVSDIKELFSLMSGRSDIPAYESNLQEVIRRVEEGTEQFIKYMREAARQAKVEKKREEEEEKLEEEELKKLQEGIEMLIEEARANTGNFKNIQFFMADYRLSNVEEITAYFKYIKQDILESTNTGLTEEQKECMKTVLSQVNQEMQELAEEIEVCFKESNEKSSSKAKEFQLAKQLLGELKGLKQEVLKFLTTKGEKLADYDPEIAREEQEQKRKKEKHPQAEQARKKSEPEYQRAKPAKNKEKEKAFNSSEKKNEYDQGESLTIQNATAEVDFYLKTLQSGNLTAEEKKKRGKILLKQVELLKKQEKAAYRLSWRLYIYNDDISEEGARWLREDRQTHKTQATQLRRLRSQLKAACKFTKEELAECRIKVKSKEKEAYETDSSDDDADLGRAETVFRKGVIKGIGQALKKAPIEFLKSFGELLQNPLITVEGLVDALTHLPELAAALAEYMQTIEGDEEAKGAEIAEFITSQILNLAGPNKIKLLNKLPKGKLGAAVLKVAQKGNKFWKLTKEGASAITIHQKYGKIYKSKSDGLWWVSVKGKGHGDAFKVFKETSKGLEWIKDADKYGNFITNKHKGPQGLFIAWGELKTVK